MGGDKLAGQVAQEGGLVLVVECHNSKFGDNGGQEGFGGKQVPC